MAQCSDAWWQPISQNFNRGLMQLPVRGLVVHITDGHGGLSSVWSDFNRIEKRASAHFCINKEGGMWQFVDTGDRAWAVDGDIQDSHWVSVENVAKLGEKLTDGQVIGCAILLRWLHEQHGVPFRRAMRANHFGLGYHHMFGIGDHVCPGMQVRMQLERVVREAWYMWWRDTGDESTPFYIRSYH